MSTPDTTSETPAERMMRQVREAVRQEERAARSNRAKAAAAARRQGLEAQR